MKLFYILLLIVETSIVQGQDAGATASNQLIQLYKVIHSVALPSAGDIEVPVTQRLALLLPGKVLNYFDYYPGDAYVAQQRLQDPNSRFQEIPPRISENMFKLSDIVPGLNPFAGSETGQSLATIYRDIVGQLTIRGFETLSENQKKQCMEASGYLLSKTEDPDTLQEVTRLSLYRKYQRRYNELRSTTENFIEGQRRNLSSIDYQYWFTRNYPSIQAEVDGAYIEWLVFGEKETIEIYLSRLGTNSPATALLEARSALRSSSRISLDRTQTIYPVTFSPSDWYRYIATEPPAMSREQIQMQISDLQSQRFVLITSKGHDSGGMCESVLADAIQVAEGKNSMMQGTLNATVDQLKVYQCNCTVVALNNPSMNKMDIPECQEYESMRDQVLGNVEDSGSATAELAELQAYQSQSDIAGVDNRIAQLDEEIASLQVQLAVAPPPVSEIAGDSEAFDPNDQWQSFEFTYSSQTQATSTSSFDSAYSSAASSSSYSRSGSWWSRRSSGSSSSSSSSSSVSLSNAYSRITGSDISVSGKILRVTVQRPWFRPSLFRSKKYEIRDDAYSLSPGPLPEKDFLNVANDSATYKLPQYMTAFLLGRNIDLSFSGIDKTTSSSIMRAGTSSYASGGSGGSSGWGPVAFSSASSYRSSASSRRSRSAFNSQSTGSGMKIRVPGVQIMGYYTQVTPRFPIPLEEMDTASSETAEAGEGEGGEEATA